MKLIRLLVVLLLLNSVAVIAEVPGVNWKPWSDDVFATATKEKKLVLLDLEAVWCHWCHVMEKETYSNSDVQKILADNFIALKVDQDSRPDLASRFQDYGWPATIIFDGAGTPLVKHAGFIDPKEMVTLLKEVVKNPKAHDDATSPKLVAVNGDGIPESVRNTLIEKHYGSFDNFVGGLKTSHKYLDPDSAEFSLVRASQGGIKDEEMAKLTLHSNLKLIDPVWGGVYQYSVKGDWSNPHFEKIISAQANNIRLYSLAYSLWKNEEYKTAAQSVFNYVNTFLKSPEGVFYVSQDADVVRGEHSDEYFKLDDAGRRAKGIPIVDKNIYSRENGLMINALCALYSATGDSKYLEAAITATKWIMDHRALPGGGYSHGEHDQGGPFLADTLAMGKALLSLYAVTGSREWLKASENAAVFISDNFVDQSTEASQPGILISKPNPGSVLKPAAQRDENIAVARYANLLARFTGKDPYKQLSKKAIAFLGISSVALENVVESGILLADSEYREEPLHITIVAGKDDPKGAALFKEALGYFSSYKRTDWWDKREGPMVNPDVEYPQLPMAAAFVCTNKRCSLPIQSPEKVATTVKMLTSSKAS